MLWPILIVVAANTAYHISAKSTPANVNSFASLTVTYVVARFVQPACFFVTSGQKNRFHCIAGLIFLAK